MVKKDLTSTTEHNSLVPGTMTDGPVKGLSIVKQEKTILTKADVQRMFAGKKGKYVTQDVITYINEANNNPDFNGDEFIHKLIEYGNIVELNGVGVLAYVKAMKFCAYLEASNGNAYEAYIRARGDEEFVKARLGFPAGSLEYDVLASAAARYRKSTIVKQILTQSEMPLYLMFQGYRYKAVEVLAKEMHNAHHAKDRINAADKLLAHVKPPENMQVELTVGRKEESAIVQLQEQLATLAMNQKRHLEAGSIDLAYTGSMRVNMDVIDADTDDDVDSNEGALI